MLYFNRFIRQLRDESTDFEMRFNIVKLLYLSLGLLLMGCSTNKLEKRRTERLSSYHALSPEFKTVVDRGEIKVGMPEDGVYIAWGKPSEILHMEDTQGASVKWLYEGTYLQEYRYWSQPNYGFRGSRDYDYGYSTYGNLQTDYLPRDYVSAEVDFINGKVKSWRMRPRPR